MAGWRVHPQNTEFQWRATPDEGLSRLSHEQKRQFDRDGYTVVRGAFTPKEIAEVEAAIDPLEQEHEAKLRASEKTNLISMADAITFTGHIVKRSPVLKAFAAHPAIRGICRDLIGEDVRLYWDQSVYKKSGKPQEFPWHQDNGYTYIEPQQYLTCWVPLVDVDVENGCPWVAPGMHRLGTLEHWRTETGLRCLDEAPDAQAAEARRGDVIVFSSLAPHRTGPNLKAGTVRKAYILQYAPDGAEAIHPDGARVAQTDPDRQFFVLKEGEPA